MASSVNQFAKSLVTSGLMTADEVKSYWNGIPNSERPADESGFAQRLVDQERLTGFQARELLAGRGSRLVLGDYLLLAEIGAGGMGQVFKAQHKHMKRIVALKLLSNAAMGDAEAVRRFEREVEAAARLDHPNIVTAYDSGHAGSVRYLAMQFVDGTDLADLIYRSGPLSYAVAAGYVAQAAAGLAYAHEAGIVHRDIKPANLLLDKKGIVRILDMGIASIDDGRDALTGNQQVMGTADYMSPEQGFSSKGVDARTDIYSLGCTLWFLLTGRKVYEGESLVARVMAHRDAALPSLLKLRRDMPRELERVLHRMLAKQPQDRPQTMNEVIAALQPFVEGSGSAADVRQPKTPRRNTPPQLRPISGDHPPDLPIPSLPETSTAFGFGSNPSGSRSNGFDGTAAFTIPVSNSVADRDTDPMTRTVSYPAVPNRSTQHDPTQLYGQAPAPAAAKKKPIFYRLIATGVVGLALLLVAGIIVKVKDKDGNVVAELNVPAGASVEITPTVEPTIGPPKTPAAIAPSATMPPVSPPTNRVAPATAVTDIAEPKGAASTAVAANAPGAAEILTSPEYVWSTPELVNALLESEQRKSLPTLSADENCLVLSAMAVPGDPYLIECRRSSADLPFGPPVRLTGFSGASAPCLSPDALQLFYVGVVDTDTNSDIWLRRRATRDAPWGAPERLGPNVNSRSHDMSPNISADNLTLLFFSDRVDGQGKNDIWMARRSTPEAPFEKAVNLGPSFNTPEYDSNPKQVADGFAFMAFHAPNGYSLSHRTPSGTITTTPLKGLPASDIFRGAPNHDIWPSSDGRRLYFVANPAGQKYRGELWMTRRITKAEAAALAAKGPAPPPTTVVRSALRFRGSDYVDLGNGWTYDGGDFTFEAWMMPDAGSGLQTFLSIDQEQAGRRSGLRIARDARSGTLHALHSSEQRHQAFADDTRPNELVHLAVVWLGRQQLLFVNGRRYAPRLLQPPAGATTKTSYAWLGAMPGDSAEPATQQGWTGTLLQTRISSRARYIETFVPPKQFTSDSDTVSLFRFEEGKGDVLRDHSGRNRNGTIASGEWVNVSVPAAAAISRPTLKPPELSPADGSKPVNPSAFLDDLPEKNWLGDGALAKHGIGPGNQPIRTFGNPIAHSLYVPTNTTNDRSSVEYDLGGLYENFSTRAVLLKRSRGPHVFRVFTDGRQIWQSPPLTEPSIEYSFGFMIAGAKTLRLEVSGPAGDSQPMWLEPRLGPIFGVNPAERPKPIEVPPGEWVDVLKLIDPALDKFDVPNVTKKNDWRIENGELHYRGDDGEGNLVWPIEFNGPGLEFDVQFTRIGGDRGLSLCVPSLSGGNAISFDAAQAGRVVFGDLARAVGGVCEIKTGTRGRVGLIVMRNSIEDLTTPLVDGNRCGTMHHIRPTGYQIVRSTYEAAAWRQVLRIDPKQEYVFHVIRARTLQGGSIEPRHWDRNAAAAGPVTPPAPPAPAKPN